MKKKMQSKEKIAILISVGSTSPERSQVCWGLEAYGGHQWPPQGEHNLRGTNHSYVCSLTHAVVWGDGFGLPYPSSCFSFDARCSKFFVDGVSLKSCLFSHCLECKQIATNRQKAKGRQI